MAEQAGILAIRKQHLYGQAYGKFNAKNLFIKRVLLPLVVILLGSDYPGSHKLITLIQNMWPQDFLDAQYFARKDYVPKLSKDQRTMISQKMSSGRRERIMRGWDKEALPDDKALMHSRWMPTTKTTWRKHKRVTSYQRYQAAKNMRHQDHDWRRSYMPR